MEGIVPRPGPVPCAPVHDETALWDALAAQLDALAAARDAGGPPPDLADFVPPVGDPTRGLALVELVKLDMERRATTEQSLPVEDYVRAFPDLAPEGEWDYVAEDFPSLARLLNG